MLSCGEASLPVVMAAGRVFIVFAVSQAFSLLCLLFAKQSILKSPVDTQISLQKDFYGHSSFYMDESQLLKMFLMKRASRHFVMSVRMKFQKSRVSYSANCTASFNPAKIISRISCITPLQCFNYPSLNM